jgi:hypothetical protein
MRGKHGTDAGEKKSEDEARLLHCVDGLATILAG